MLGGLADPVLDSQRIFRVALEAMAHPGRVVTLPTPVEVPSPLTAGAAALCLALLDFETPLWLDRQAATAEVIDYLRFHCGVSVVEKPEVAVFALIARAEAMPSLAVFASGSDEYPDRSIDPHRPGPGTQIRDRQADDGTGHRRGVSAHSGRTLGGFLVYVAGKQ